MVHSSSMERPTEIDSTSSEYYVYERKNIHEEVIENENGTTKQWVYQERMYTKEEYENLNSPTTQMIMQNIADIAVDLAMLKEVKSNV